MNPKIIFYLEILLKIFIVVFFIELSYYHTLNPAGSGDEILFINDLNFIKNHGWIAAIEKSIAVPYLLLVYPFSFIFQDYVALRLVNVLLFATLLFYFYKWGNIKNKLFYFYFLFLNSVGLYLSGTNDMLFAAAIVIFFHETYKILEGKNDVKVPLMLSALVVAFFTRELIYVYIPVVVFSLILLWKSQYPLRQKIVIPVAVFAFFIIVNLPSLLKNHKISYDNKEPNKELKVTWAQRQYLAQLLVNKGELADQHHPSWEVTRAYLETHGENSLPKSTFGGIFFDIKLTILEFFKDFKSSLWFSIRQTGLTVVLVFGFLLFQLFKRKISTHLYLPTVSIVLIATFSFIIISFIEPRWLFPAFTLAMLYYSDLEFDKKLPRPFFLFHHLVLFLVMFYGTYKVLLKL